MQATWPETDPAVVDRFLQGDAEAFSVIYHSFVPALLAYAAAICGSREQAEDIVQDVFVVCWEKKQQIQGDVLSHWLVKVTRNMAVKAFRQNVLLAEYQTSGLHEAGEAIAPGYAADDLSKAAQAMAIVNALPPVRKKIFLLSRIDQKSYRQIAEELGISVRTVENQLSAALKHIRHHQLSVTNSILLLIMLLRSSR